MKKVLGWFGKGEDKTDAPLSVLADVRTHIQRSLPDSIYSKSAMISRSERTMGRVLQLFDSQRYSVQAVGSYGELLFIPDYVRQDKNLCIDSDWDLVSVSNAAQVRVDIKKSDIEGQMKSSQVITFPHMYTMVNDPTLPSGFVKVQFWCHSPTRPAETERLKQVVGTAKAHKVEEGDIAEHLEGIKSGDPGLNLLQGFLEYFDLSAEHVKKSYVPMSQIVLGKLTGMTTTKQKTEDRKGVPVMKEQFGFPCAQWPELALSVFQREHPSGWPSAALLEEMRQAKVILIPRTCTHGSKSSVEFEMDFSLAENVICRSWEDPVRHILLAFNLMSKTEFAKEDHCSVFIAEHALYSMLERLPRDKFFRKETMARGFLMLLQTLANAFYDTTLPSFFLPDRNLMAHVSRHEGHRIARQLRKLLEDPATPLQVMRHSLVLLDPRPTEDAYQFSREAQEAFLKSQTTSDETEKQELVDKADQLFQKSLKLNASPHTEMSYGVFLLRGANKGDEALKIFEEVLAGNGSLSLIERIMLVQYEDKDIPILDDDLSEEVKKRGKFQVHLTPLALYYIITGNLGQPDTALKQLESLVESMCAPIRPYLPEDTHTRPPFLPLHMRLSANASILLGHVRKARGEVKLTDDTFKESGDIIDLIDKFSATMI